MRAALVCAVLGAATSALAYPQFQLSTGNVRCSQCHFAPAGGGLINGYGRSEAGDTISAGGDGRFLHGLWEPPSWLGLGADVRVAGLMVHQSQDPQPAENHTKTTDFEVFPMLADLYGRVQVAGQFSASVTLGFRGKTRPEQSAAARLISRNHYLMWREGPTGWYVRAGRFYAPYGLRLPEHTAYIERFLGFDVLEESYNVSGGYVGDEWELHLTAFTADFIRESVGQGGSGGAAYFEHRPTQALAWGAQARVSAGSETTRSQGGLVGKAFLDGPRILLLAEADLVRETFKDAGPGRWQLAGYLGAAWLPVRGWMVQLMLERWDEDLARSGVARDAIGAELQWFPTAHVELSLYGRLQVIGTGSSDGSPSQVVLLQAHYYL
ncbi:MAG TPA: hypothetical protein VKE22_22000 [Haliangiales bacterium]|nr:hypothetical protein [Haliangiales bacterium]